MDKAQPFKHSLDPLIRKQGWEVDAATQDVAALRKVREAREAELEALLRSVAAIENELRSLQDTRGIFDIDRYQALAEYLRDQRDAAEAKREEVNSAVAEHEKAVDELCELKRTQKALEKRREMKKIEHATEERQRAYRLQEDVYLMRWRPRK